MRKAVIVTMVVLFLVLSLVSDVFAARAKAYKDVLKEVEKKRRVTDKRSYLLDQAEASYDAKEYLDSSNIAQYILRYVDPESEEAMTMMKKANSALSSELRTKKKK